jgi:hypothetical protein
MDFYEDDRVVSKSKRQKANDGEDQESKENNVKCESQTFRIFNQEKNVWIQFEDNVNMYDLDVIRAKMVKKINEFQWPKDKRYVALGSYGDCVVYENGALTLCSDSG